MYFCGVGVLCVIIMMYVLLLYVVMFKIVFDVFASGFARYVFTLTRNVSSKFCCEFVDFLVLELIMCIGCLLLS